MSSCDNSNIKQNYIVTNINEFDTLTACTGIWTSNIYGCSPITIQDQLKLNSVNINNSLNNLLVIDNLTGLIQYRDINSISSGITISGTNGITNFEYDQKNTFTITRSDNLKFFAKIDSVTGFTVNGNIVITGNSEIGGDIIPTNDGTSNIGSQSKRFRNINTISGTSSVWTSTSKIITPEINLGLDILGNQRIITADNSIIQEDVLNGGTF
jgi:hypothetical protein